MKDEIGTQAWKFHHATQISRILSPKKHIQGNTHADLTGYDCAVDDPKFETALNEAQKTLGPELGKWPSLLGERQQYAQIAKFLNLCIKHGSEALNEQNLLGTWYKDLTFIEYDKPMGDGVEDAPPLKPDLGGVNAKNPGETLYWSPPDGSDDCRMQLPVEVKNEWTPMVAQAATYGRCLFSASPSRVFAVVLAVNHSQENLQFLIFHRGGLTSHRELKFTKDGAGRTDTLRILMTLLLWSKPQDAGFISTSNDAQYLLPEPSDSKEHIVATVKKVIHDSICIRGRATRVCRLSLSSQNYAAPPDSKTKGFKNKAGSKTGEKMLPIYPRYTYPKSDLEWCSPHLTLGKGTLKDGQDVILKVSWQIDSRKDMEKDMFNAAAGAFGTPAVLCSYEGTHPDGELISNRLLLPTADDISNERASYWDVFGPPGASVSPEVRTMCFTVFITIGTSLIEAKSSYELCMALVHAFLGWLSYYQSGFMQRDISIGNVLLTIGEASSAESFCIKSDSKIMEPLWPTASVDATTAALGGMQIAESDPSKSSAQIGKEITALVEKLGIRNKFTAFVTDGDMAAEWPTYFDNEHNLDTRSGTMEFMSLALQGAMDTNTKYVQSPVDDIQSFFWLAVWAVLNNTKPQMRSEPENQWRRDMLSGHRGLKSALAFDLLTRDFEEGCSLVGAQVFPLLKLWWQKQLALAADWSTKVTSKSRRIPSEETRDFYLHHLHLYALRGVKEFLEIVVENHDALKSYGDFPLS